MRNGTSVRAALLAAACLIPGSVLRAQHVGHDSAARGLHGGPHGGAMASQSSGTSWVPGASPMRMAMRQWGTWSVGGHARAFVQYVDQGTRRGDRQLGVTDWEMLTALRDVAGGRLQFSAMTTLEPFTLGGGGYPLLLQTGRTYRHAYLHDRQHPHAALMELSAQYTRPIGALSAFVYAGAVGEPALGPPAAMHRPSAENDPMAPLGHHWQDASHQSFGVVTAGVSSKYLKLEASAFNPRETDEDHPFVDYRGAALDSYSGRVSVAPTSRVVASAWWGYLSTHSRLDPTARMHRYGGSLLASARGVRGGTWSSAVVWGMNLHHHGGSSHAIIHGSPGASPHHHASSVLAETGLGLGTRTTVFVRAEAVRKNGEELGFLGGDLTQLYGVQSYVMGATRDVVQWGGASVALGLRGSVNVVPATLLATYGTRTPRGLVVFARVRAGGEERQPKFR